MARSAAKLAVVPPTLRPIRSVYYSDLTARTVEKVNRGLHARSAVPRAIDHMQVNHYSALLCEVYDDTTGELHAVIRRKVDKGEIVILYRREVTEEM